MGDAYKGVFDEGYEAIRPDGQPWPRLDLVRPWETLSPDEKRLFIRMAEVFAGYVSWPSRTTAAAARAGLTERSTSGGSSTACPHRPNCPWSTLTSSAARSPATTTRPAGPGRSTPRSRTGRAGPVTRAAWPTCAWSPGRPRSSRNGKSVSSTSTRSTSSPRSTSCWTSSHPRSSGGTRRARSRVRASRPRSPTPPCRESRPSSTRCWGSARSTTTGGWPAPFTRLTRR